MSTNPEIEQLLQTISGLEAQRGVLGEAVVEAALAPLRARLAALQGGPPAEQRKLVTVLFADLAGFTRLASGLDPEDVREIINAYFARWSACIQRHGGMVEKFIGDAVVAVFGLPAAHEDDPARAIRAALDMQSELGALNETLHAERGLRLAMRTGIHTGEVVASLLGERQGEQFIVVGDAVNLTARLQAAAPEDGILVSAGTYRHVRGLFETRAFGALELKGVPEPLTAYRILAARPHVFYRGGRDVAGVETPLVGRQKELHELQSALGQVIEARARQVITVVGEAGMGKSRLLHEFEQWVELLPEQFFYFRGRALPALQYTPYSLIHDVFALRSQVQDSDPPPVVRARLEEMLAAALPDDPEAHLKAHWIARLLGFEIGESEHLGAAAGGAAGGASGAGGATGSAPIGASIDAKAFHDQALVYLGDYFRAIGASGPAVVLLEDLHWADDSSLDLIYRLDGSLSGLPFLIIGAARPGLYERRPEWGEGLAFHTRLDLGPLSPQESQAMVGEILKKVRPLPPALPELITASAEGNPFYIEELVKMLIEDGVILPGEPDWQVRHERLGVLQVPPTLTGVLQARLDTLEPPARACLQRAAVIGRTFWDGAVAALGDPSAGGHAGASEVAAVLDALQPRELVYRRRSSTFEDLAEYLFKHALLRDVAYAGLLKRQRRIYHGQAAGWLEELTARTHRAAEFSMQIAGHYEQAGQAQVAAEWYLRAGRAAAGRFANSEALRALDQALALAPQAEPAWLCAVLLEREKVYDLLGRRGEQLADLEALRRHAERSGDAALLGQAALRRASFDFNTSELAGGLEAASQAEEFAAQIDDARLGAEAALLQAAILIRQGELDQAEERCRRTLSLAGEQRLPGIAGHGYRQLGMVAYYKGESRRARDHFAQALESFEQAGDRVGQGQAINNMGGASFNMGEYELAGQYYTRSLELCRALGDRSGQGRALNNLGIVAVSQGRYDEAEQFYLLGLEIIREVGQRSHEMSALDNLGNLAAYRYDYLQAIAYQRQALEGSRQLGERMTERFALINLARSHLSLGQYAQGEACVSEALEVNLKIEDQQGICHAYKHLSLHRLKTGDPAAALDFAERSLAVAQESDLPSEEGWAHHAAAEALSALARPDEALAHFEQALEIRRKLGEEIETVETQAALGALLLSRADLPGALGHVESVLQHLAARGPQGFEQPGAVFLSCVRVLQAAGDGRAGEVLRQGCEVVAGIAGRIGDEDARGVFLEGVEENRELRGLCKGREEED